VSEENPYEEYSEELEEYCRKCCEGCPPNEQCPGCDCDIYCEEEENITQELLNVCEKCCDNCIGEGNDLLYCMDMCACNCDEFYDEVYDDEYNDIDDDIYDDIWW